MIFNNDVNNHEKFYDILHNYAERKIPGLLSLLEKWKHNTPEVYFEVLQIIPNLVKKLDLRFTHQQIEQHRKILKKSIEELTFALEDKLK